MQRVLIVASQRYPCAAALHRMRARANDLRHDGLVLKADEQFAHAAWSSQSHASPGPLRGLAATSKRDPFFLPHDSSRWVLSNRELSSNCSMRAKRARSRRGPVLAVPHGLHEVGLHGGHVATCDERRGQFGRWNTEARRSCIGGFTTAQSKELRA